MLSNKPYEQRLQSTMSVQQCAQRFKDIIEDSMNGMKNRKAAQVAAAAGYKPGFYSPKGDSSLDAFGGLLGDQTWGGDAPEFEIAAYVPTFGGSAKGEGAHIHMYVWDRGSAREVVVSSRATSRGHRSHASKLFDRVAQALS